MTLDASTKRVVSTVSIRMVWPFLELAERSNHPEVVTHVQEQLGLTPSELEDPDTRVPFQRVADLLEWAVHTRGNRNVGLIAARFVVADHIGIAEFLARSKPTLRDAMESSARYVRLLADGVHWHLEVREDAAISSLRLDPDLQLHDVAYEFVLALGFLRLRRISGLTDLTPREVSFMHDAPADTSLYSEVFGCPVRFGAEETQLVIPAASLELPTLRAESGLSRVLERHADALLEGLPRPNDLTERVRAMLLEEGELRDTSAERVARRLGMSVRTLARKLADENTRLRDLVDDLRKQRALRDLAQTELTITEIAHKQGYANSQSLHRALHRWTGTSAGRWRLQARKRNATNA